MQLEAIDLRVYPLLLLKVVRMQSGGIGNSIVYLCMYSIFVHECMCTRVYRGDEIGGAVIVGLVCCHC